MLQEILLIVFGIVCLFIICYILVITLKMKMNKCAWEEAKASIDNTLEKIFNFFKNQHAQTMITYPVLIASNGITIIEEIIHNYFSTLGKYYEIWFFDKCFFPTPNIIEYDFRGYDYIGNFNRISALHKFRRVGEKALTLHFRDIGFYNYVIDNFVAVDIVGDTLRFFFAYNNKGFEEIQSIRQRVKGW